MHYDAVIVGGGLVGASLALALGKLNYHVLLVEKKPFSSEVKEEERTLALSYASFCIYSTLGVKPPSLHPLHTVKVMVEGYEDRAVDLDCKDQTVNTLGFVVGARDLEKTIYEQLALLTSIKVHDGTLTHHLFLQNKWQLILNKNQTVETALLIAADGAHSALRAAQNIPCDTTTYGHEAIVAQVNIQLAFPCTAIERFLSDGAIALLPWENNKATCVWTMNAKAAQKYHTAAPEDFLRACQQQLGSAGIFEALIRRDRLPLTMQLARYQHRARFLLMGNAAHHLHPIAAQGLNLSLRDIWQLRSQILKSQHSAIKKDLGARDFLTEYVRARQIDQARVIFMTDKIARFMSGGPLSMRLRAAGITLFDSLLPLKPLFTRLCMGLI